MDFDKPNGLIGNEDCGQMSSWYVLSAMGFYPVTPGTDYYVIGTPVFEKIIIHLENGKNFIINANNISAKNIYIQSAKLNRKDYNNSFLLHADIMNGGEIIFEMGSQPNKDWGNGENNIPKTEITDYIITPSPFAYALKPSFSDSMYIKLGSIDPNSKIYYSTTNQNFPIDGELYENPILITNTTKIKFISISSDNTSIEKSQIMEATYTKIPKNVTIKLETEFAPQYSAGGNNALIDGITGINDFRLGDWQGYQGVDLHATIDFGKKIPVNSLSIRFLQDINSWIFMPEKVEFYTSDNGKDFIYAGVEENDIAQNNWDIVIKDFKINVSPKQVRYVRIIAKNIETCPKDHKAAGHKAWIFADEIIVK